MTEHADKLARYKQLRKVGLELNNRLMKTLSKSILDEGGHKLGILKKNVLVLDSEDEVALLADFCIYNVRRDGKNAIERYLEEAPPPPDSDEMVLLQAMRQARYSLFECESAELGVGVYVRDLLRGERLFLMDVGFSQTGSPGLILAARVMAPEGMNQTTGAALPVGRVPPGQRYPFLQELVTQLGLSDPDQLARPEGDDMVARLIRSCLQAGAAERIAYSDPGTAPQRGPAPASRGVRRVGRNDPCPCGSGKKFKQCCGKHR
jgi:hypothetical protein